MKNPYQRYKKLDRPPLRPQVTTLWEYPSSNYGKGTQGDPYYRGSTPSYVIWNVLERYSKPGDTVLDPFCGSGTTLDVCRDLGRDGIGFDIAPPREDVRQGDARRLPLEDNSVDIAFMDPPYADNLTYSRHEQCIGETKAHDGSWHQAMADVVGELSRVVKPGGIVAMYLADVLKKRTTFFPLGIDLATIARQRLVFVDHVAVVRHNKQLSQGNHREAAEENNFFLRGFNHLLLFRVPTKGERATGPTPDVRAGRRRSAPPGRAAHDRDRGRGGRGGRGGGGGRGGRGRR